MYRECFVSNHDIQSLRSFVKAAGKSHRHLYYAKVNDDLWSIYVLDAINDVAKGSVGLKQKTLVTCVGRQPCSSTWVLAPDIHIDQFGQLIPQEQQEYFWYVTYFAPSFTCLYEFMHTLNFATNLQFSFMEKYLECFQTVSILVSHEC